MKTNLRFLYSLFFLLFLFSCKKEENRVILQGGTAPVVTVQTDAAISYENASLTALTVSWTNPNYTLNTGVSSFDVSYNIEIDTAADFSNPAKATITVSKDLSYSFIVSNLNDIMLNTMQLKAGVPHTLMMRVISALPNSSAKLVSNVVQLEATPYSIPPKVTLPSDNKLFLVGSASQGGWNNPVPTPSQEFTQVTETQYELTVDLAGGQEYLLLPVNGSWDHKYAVKDKTVSGLNAGGSFGYDLGDNIPGPSASGTYKITVDFQRGVFTVTKL